MDKQIKIETVEMHTGGEPLRIVKSGLPPLPGKTILDKRRYLRENLDNIRKMLIFEPRGHYDMYGVYLVEPDYPGADLGCIFIHNEGYSTMCGHAVIALGRYAVDYGLVSNPTSPETRVKMQCPCGPVESFVEYNNGKTGNVRFNSVPAFVYEADVTVDVPGYDKVTVDISYGGAFYALLPAEQVGLDVRTSSVKDLTAAAGAVTDALKKKLTLKHMESPDLAFLYGTILTDGQNEHMGQDTANICVFADREVDRSPCGSGVTARIAQMYHRGLIELGQKRTFVGPTGSKFVAMAVREETVSSNKCVVVEVAGRGYYSGTSVFTLEPDDDIGRGFLLR